MRRFSAFLLTTALIFSCVACSVTPNPPMEDSREASNNNIEAATEDVQPEEIDEPEIDNSEIAQLAYDLIENAESLCKSGMGIIAAAWHFGIWDAPKCETDAVIEKLSAQIGFDVPFIEENGGYTASELVNGDGNFDGWEFCLMTAENCLSAAGTYTSVNEALDTARELIREIPENDSNYQSLKDYYTKVAAYAAYFENVSGSYNDLTEAITEYEKNIQEVKESLLFDFG